LHGAITSGDKHKMRNAECKCANERKRAGNNKVEGECCHLRVGRSACGRSRWSFKLHDAVLANLHAASGARADFCESHRTAAGAGE
jgi:hypothetical protein